MTASILIVISLVAFMTKRFERPWPSVVGHVLETRVSAVASQDGGTLQAGLIMYRVEAHVTYEVNGEKFDRWLPASDIKSDKTYLEFWLSQKKNKLCIVHWNPGNPSDIEALLT